MCWLPLLYWGAGSERQRGPWVRQDGDLGVTPCHVLAPRVWSAGLFSSQLPTQLACGQLGIFFFFNNRNRDFYFTNRKYLKIQMSLGKIVIQLIQSRITLQRSDSFWSDSTGVWRQGRAKGTGTPGQTWPGQHDWDWPRC